MTSLTPQQTRTWPVHGVRSRGLDDRLRGVTLLAVVQLVTGCASHPASDAPASGPGALDAMLVAAARAAASTAVSTQ